MKRLISSLLLVAVPMAPATAGADPVQSVLGDAASLSAPGSQG